MNEATHEMNTLKTKLKATWNTGDYGTVAQYLEQSAVEFVERIPVEPGTRALDVACGAGQAAFPLARAGCDVTGVDIASKSIEQARDRARAEGLEICFEEGDAEALPYEDATFDLVISLIGAMFAPRPERVAAELTRVCRPGGRIVMANWTPEGFIGQFLKIVGGYVPPPALMPSPLKWGDEATVRERFGNRVEQIRLTRRMYPFRYPFPPSAVVEHYFEHYGPTNRAYAALDPDGQKALRTDLERLWTEHNRATDDTTYVDAEILEVVAIRQ